MKEPLDILKFSDISKLDDSEVATPQSIVSDMVDLIPAEEFNPDTKFLDPSCTSGRFPIEIKRRLMSSPLMQSAFPDEHEREKHILDNQIYAVCSNDVSAFITRKMLYGNVIKEGNVKYILGYNQLVASQNYKKLIKEGFWNMKFDVVIGNPPYQDRAGRSSIYDKFATLAARVSSIVCFITRDNWMNGKAFEKMRNTMLSNGAIKKIVHYPVVGEVFSDVQVSVSIFLWKQGEASKAEYSCIRHGEVVISQKIDISDGIIYKSELGKSIIDKADSVSNWTATFKTRSYPFMDQRKRYGLKSSRTYSSEYNVKVIVNKENPVYVSSDNFSNLEEVGKCKVICGVIINEASAEKPGNVLTNICVLGINIVSSESWSLIAVLDTIDEAVNCQTYIKTKYVRFLANQSVNGRSNVTDNTFRFVPLQDFTVNSDIDWTQSVSDIDQQLYKKYNLTPEEIDYIEKTIKPME